MTFRKTQLTPEDLQHIETCKAACTCPTSGPNAPSVGLVWQPAIIIGHQPRCPALELIWARAAEGNNMSIKRDGLADLIEALTIFRKYGDSYSPTHCEHDVLSVCASITQDIVSAEDTARLKELGFFWSSEYDNWASFRFGSC